LGEGKEENVSCFPEPYFNVFQIQQSHILRKNLFLSSIPIGMYHAEKKRPHASQEYSKDGVIIYLSQLSFHVVEFGKFLLIISGGDWLIRISWKICTYISLAAAVGRPHP